MRPVNLIPAEERRGESAPLRPAAASYVVARRARGRSDRGHRDRPFRQLDQGVEGRHRRAPGPPGAGRGRSGASSLPYDEFASTSQARVETVKSLADSRFDWERVLHEVALVIPKDTWLESMSGTVAPGVSLSESSGDAGAADPSIVGPSLHIIGCARSQDSVAGFVSALEDIDGATRVGVKSSELGDATADPTAAAQSEPGKGPTGTCQTKAFIAKFDVTVAFDAVPVSEFTPGTPVDYDHGAGTNLDHFDHDRRHGRPRGRDGDRRWHHRCGYGRGLR